MLFQVPTAIKMMEYDPIFSPCPYGALLKLNLPITMRTGSAEDRMLVKALKVRQLNATTEYAGTTSRSTGDCLLF